MLQQHRLTHSPLLANLRHELCMPINGMLCDSQLLLDQWQDRLATTMYEDLQKIHDCSRQLLMIVTTLLDPAQFTPSQIDGDLSRFSSTLRIELLAPLNKIIGYCELLVAQAPAASIPDVDRLNAAAKYLMSLINDISNLIQILAAQENSALAVTPDECITANTSRENLYLQHVERLTEAAAAIEARTFNPDSLAELIEYPDRFGQLARVLHHLGCKVASRERRLLRKIRCLEQSLDEERNNRPVSETGTTDNFGRLLELTKRSDTENLYRSSPYPSLAQFESQRGGTPVD